MVNAREALVDLLQGIVFTDMARGGVTPDDARRTVRDVLYNLVHPDCRALLLELLTQEGVLTRPTVLGSGFDNSGRRARSWVANGARNRG